MKTNLVSATRNLVECGLLNSSSGSRTGQVWK